MSKLHDILTKGLKIQYIKQEEYLLNKYSLL